MGTLITLFLALFAIGFLIFIHELGHYFVAKWMGMEVEAFGIGFGKSLFSWKRKGVEWRLNWLPFGGYVKIKGMELAEGTDPYKIPNSFYSKGPLQRMAVAVAGPLVNLLFALLAFTFIWAAGGRTKNFTEFTNKIGWIDPKSELYALGVRPGDEIDFYDDRPFTEMKDHIYGPMTAGKTLHVKGLRVDYATGGKQPFDFEVDPYPHPLVEQEGILTSGIINSANFVVYSPSEMKGVVQDIKIEPRDVGGIQEGDRIVWVDGERIFSQTQMSELLNDGRVLLTVQRGDSTFLARVPRVPIGDLKLSYQMKEEMSDWQHESQLIDEKLNTQYAIPYDLTPEGVVEGKLSYIDQEEGSEAFPSHPYSEKTEPLQVGDKIVAVDGTAVKYPYQIFYQLQKRRVHAIVLRGSEVEKHPHPAEAERIFETAVNASDLDNLVKGFETGAAEKQSGDLILLEPIIPVKQIDLYTKAEDKADFINKIKARQKEIDQIEVPKIRERATERLKREQDKILLGLTGIQDVKVVYNPGPFTMIKHVGEEMWHTMKSLFTGNLSPKWMSGPIGMVQVVQHSWGVSAKEALYWLGLISMNLGLLNLLPIPVLDGGYILLFFFEWLTGKKIQPKALERLILPFVILLVLFFLFIAFHDLSRVFS